MKNILNSLLFSASIILASNSIAAPVSVVVHDIELEVEKQGQGNITVVFEAGFGSDLHTWQPVIAALSANYTTVAYSRAGLGKSSAAATPRTIQQHIADLQALLKTLQVSNNIILVGHSYGGLLATEYARQFPQQIKALVLVDPAVMAQRRVFLQADEKRVRLDDQMMLKMMPPTMQADYQTLLQQLDAAEATVNPIAATVPTILLTATKHHDEPLVFEETAQGKQLWLTIHNALFSNVIQGSHIRIATSEHNLHHQQPQRVAQAIMALANTPE